MELVISGTFSVSLADAPIVAQALRDVAVPTRVEAGCIFVEISEAADAAGVFHVFSRWVDDAAFERHTHLDHTRRFFETVQPLLVAPAEFRRMRPVA